MHRIFLSLVSGPIAGGRGRVCARARRSERPLLEIERRPIKALHRKGPLRNCGESRRIAASHRSRAATTETGIRAAGRGSAAHERQRRMKPAAPTGCAKGTRASFGLRARPRRASALTGRLRAATTRAGCAGTRSRRGRGIRQHAGRDGTRRQRIAPSMRRRHARGSRRGMTDNVQRLTTQSAARPTARRAIHFPRHRYLMTSTEAISKFFR